MRDLLQPRGPSNFRDQLLPRLLQDVFGTVAPGEMEKGRLSKALYILAE